MNHTMKCKISSSPIVHVIVTDRGNDDYADTFSNGVMVWLRFKVPKCEIFDRSDFPDFYTIKSSRVGDLVVKILTYYCNF